MHYLKRNTAQHLHQPDRNILTKQVIQVCTVDVGQVDPRSSVSLLCCM